LLLLIVGANHDGGGGRRRAREEAVSIWASRPATAATSPRPGPDPAGQKVFVLFFARRRPTPLAFCGRSLLPPLLPLSIGLAAAARRHE
jgi:hypothetical protein